MSVDEGAIAQEAGATAPEVTEETVDKRKVPERAEEAADRKSRKTGQDATEEGLHNCSRWDLGGDGSCGYRALACEAVVCISNKQKGPVEEKAQQEPQPFHAPWL